MKPVLRGAESEVKRTEINGISGFKFTSSIISPNSCWKVGVFLHAVGVADDETAQRHSLLPSEASR